MQWPARALLDSMSAGVITLVAVLAAATVFGLAWRSRQGRLRAPRRSGRATVPAAAGQPDGAGRREVTGQPGGTEPAAGTGQPAGGASPAPAPAPAGRDALTSADLRHDLGARATLVQFSSAFCAPCRATRQVLTEVAGMVDDVSYVEIDAESRLDLVRRLNIYATPAVMVLAPDGSIVRQATGQPRKADVIAALGALPAPGEQGLPVISHKDGR
jgi:thiol-disulfide isomerase/thioredoxin